jgi:deoxyribonuclease V
MDLSRHISTPTSLDEGRRIQREIAARVITEDPVPRFPPQFIAGADAAYSRDGIRVFGAMAVLRCPDLSLVEVQCAERPLEFPYVPAMFAFREGPVLLATWRRLTIRPDLVIFHGHGIAHPEGCGLASHLGVLLDTPAIGVAGRPLGTPVAVPGPRRGDTAPVQVDGRITGCAVRTRAGSREVDVSPGHRIRLETAVRIVLSTSTRFRLPEPLPAAHRHAVECRAQFGKL